MEALQVQETNLPQIKMWNNQRVVTFDDIETVHERPSGTAKKNFQNNKKHFIKDVDYFEITRKELRENFSPNSNPLKGNPNLKSYLFTESGYLMVVKSFTDDLSWEVQRRLVNGYFKAQAQEQQKPKKFDLSEIPPWELETSAPKYEPIPERVWYPAEKPMIDYICKEMHISRKTLFHRILVELSNWVDLKVCREDYKAVYGQYPAYNLDILDAYIELENIVDEYLTFIERSLVNYQR